MSEPSFPSTGGTAKSEELYRSFPRAYDATGDELLSALLLAISDADHALADDPANGARAAADSLFLDTATGVELAVIGQNYGVQNPPAFGFDDITLRRFIQAMAFKPKTVLARVDEILTIILGPRETAGWSLYEVRSNTLTVEVAGVVAERTHNDSTFLKPKAVAETSALPGDYLVLSGAPNPAPNAGEPIDGNNAVWLAGDAAVQSPQEEVLRLVIAGGVTVEFKRKGE